MTDSVTFLHHTEEGTLVELKGNVHYIDDKLCIRIADMKEILRLYNGMQRRNGKQEKHNDRAPMPSLKQVLEECNT